MFFIWSYLWHCSKGISNDHKWQWWFLLGSSSGSWILDSKLIGRLLDTLKNRCRCWQIHDEFCELYLCAPRLRSSDRKGTLVVLCHCRLVLSGVCSCSLLLLSCWPQTNALPLPGKRHPTILETSLVGWLVSWLVVWSIGSVVGCLVIWFCGWLPVTFIWRPFLGCWVGRSVTLLVV